MAYRHENLNHPMETILRLNVSNAQEVGKKVHHVDRRFIFVEGDIFNVAAQDLAMLIIDRLLDMPLWILKTAKEKCVQRLVHMSADLARQVSLMLEDNNGISGKGAKQVVVEGGKIPKMASMLRKIPGIRDYTAGAIASIAFNVMGGLCDLCS
ncbi:hypothetical protein RIF29_34657 [Crotalaria pallida]|uniref:Uncharacterized protein n=1 Tax=Crotalaria pallida TaxID=3830 RepID=A0AAN9HTG0_CROPI